jgi:hypothetical protein
MFYVVRGFFCTGDSHVKVELFLITGAVYADRLAKTERLSKIATRGD